jgi:phospholipid N-methyltransferase
MPELPVAPQPTAKPPATPVHRGQTGCCGGHTKVQDGQRGGGCDEAHGPVPAAPGRQGSRFLREFLANPIATAAIAPSSRHLAAAMLRGVDLGSMRTVVEFGPGTGVFTRAVLEGLRAAGNTGAEFIAIEKNPRMAAALQQEFALLGADGGGAAPVPGVQIVAGDALDVDSVLGALGQDHADFILSGLGWPSIPAAIRDAILEKTAAALPAGREFRTFGYHIGLTLPGAWGFRRTVRRLFSRVTISPVVWRNLPPAFVYSCVK